MQRFRYIILASMGVMLLTAFAWGLEAGQIKRNKQRDQQQEAYLEKYAKEDSLKRAFIEALNAENADVLNQIEQLMNENAKLQAFWRKQKHEWNEKTQDIDVLLDQLYQGLPKESEKYDELLDKLKQIRLVSFNQATEDPQNTGDSAL